VLRSPAVPKGRIDLLVSLIDVAPTLLSLARLRVPETMIGMDATAETGDLERTLFSQTHIRSGAGLREDGGAVTAMREGNRKLILDPAGTRCLDLIRDPLERDPVACDPAEVDRATHWSRDNERQASRPDEVGAFEITPKDRSALEALGYGD